MGVFTQSGGTNTIATNLYVYSKQGPASSYTLSNSASLSATDEYVGGSGMGVFTQSGGTNTIATNLYVYSKQGPASSYTLSNSASLSATDEYVGAGDGTGGSGIGTFTTRAEPTRFPTVSTFSPIPALPAATRSAARESSRSQITSMWAAQATGNGLGTFTQSGGTNSLGVVEVERNRKSFCVLQLRRCQQLHAECRLALPHLASR